MNRRSLLSLIGLAPLGVPALGAPAASLLVSKSVHGKTLALASGVLESGVAGEELGASAIKISIDTSGASASLADLQRQLAAIRQLRRQCGIPDDPLASEPSCLDGDSI